MAILRMLELQNDVRSNFMIKLILVNEFHEQINWRIAANLYQVDLQRVIRFIFRLNFIIIG
jgi:hypothetical protein